MQFKIEVGSIWEYGQRKDEVGNPHQEDSLFPAHGKNRPSDRIFILCDGMGGHAAGEVASATVCEAMSNSLLPLKESYSDNDINKAVTAAYDALDAKDNSGEGKSKMGTTMTCLVMHKEGATIAHMGDSRVYHIRPGKEREDTQILFQTRDHSLVNDLIAVGEITPEEAKNHPRKNVITRALQPNTAERQKADIKAIVDIKPGDWFYLCSDGMLEQMDDDAIRFIFSDATGGMDKKIEMLTLATRENRDNHTAILIHVLGVEKQQPTNTVPPLMGALDDEKREMETEKTSVVKTAKDPFAQMESLKRDEYDEPFGNKRPPKNKTLYVVLIVIAALIVGLWYFGSNKNDKTPKKRPNHSQTDKSITTHPDSAGNNDTITKGKTIAMSSRSSSHATVIVAFNGTRLITLKY